MVVGLHPGPIITDRIRAVDAEEFFQVKTNCWRERHSCEAGGGSLGSTWAHPAAGLLDDREAACIRGRPFCDQL